MSRALRRAALPTAAVAVLVLLLGLLVWLTTDDEPEPIGAREPATATTSTTTTAAEPTQSPARPGPCAEPPRRAFVPRTITIEGVARDAEVMGMPRDANGVPGVPPVAAKEAFAWDRGGVRAGAREGHVLLNTHTWPDGSAMGNALLAELQEGELIVLRGGGAATACYRVTKRVEVREEDGYAGWAATDGPPQAVIVVCSGDRLGPGRWTHRTLWFASPVR
ncbi:MULTISPECIES: class F sortase [Nocardioides]|uniref:Class F sortase n=1 Tax=Nocardioides vastitatis TaxID=2568655 RepID=A0ABW0ZJH9_9ACTN|nr:class F sortase [Nocardioides sp.]THI96485.1 class F sortase [Nocardioides sp.]